MAAPTGEIIVANHSSYLDGVLLMAALPQACRFVAKRELVRTPVIGAFLQRLGAVFVERFDVRAGVEDAHRLARLAAQGESCIFFPEGTFVRAPGLMPFHLGAFAAAVEADRPVIPLALHGARTLLPDEQWMPRRTPIAVHIGAPIKPLHAHNAFTATIQLRDAARRYILRYCGEPEVAGMYAVRSDSDERNAERLQPDASWQFDSPAALLACGQLSDVQKAALLRSWYRDALDIAVAEGEGMPAYDSDLMHEIALSLQQLPPTEARHEPAPPASRVARPAG